MNSLDEVFELFSRERRRYALYYLDQADGPVPVRQLAEAIQTWEGSGDSPTIPDDEYRNIVLRLEHRDLPKAAEAEYVTYDRDRNVIELTGSSPEFRAILSVAEAIELPDDEPMPSI